MIMNSNNNPFNYVQSNIEKNKRIRNQERIRTLEDEKKKELESLSIDHIGNKVQNRNFNMDNMNSFNKGIQNSKIKSMFNKNNF